MKKVKNPNISMPTYIVGIGASAGGLEAIQDFFDQMPSNTGVAFVVIQHLSPDFKSLMDQLLAKNTQMKIHSVKNSMPIEANNIYLIPPKQNMQIEAGHLSLTEQIRGNHLNMPVDIFFSSLAKEWGQHGIGVILSGTGSDGSKGVIELSKAGGLILVQSPESAKFDGMPRNAIATKHVDRILQIEQLPDAILEHTQGVDGYEYLGLKEKELIETENSDHYDLVFTLLMSKYKVDFHLYKQTTISRRIDRRIKALNCANLESYVEQLANDERELDVLYKDLLIGVTDFFRDQGAFELLQAEVIPKIIEGHRSSRDEIRLWVPACSTGEEAYSMGIMLHEYLTENKIHFDIKIFATDVSKDFIEFAGAGIYTQEQVASVSAERLKRYFIHLQDEKYQIIEPIRNMVVFAQHNIITDPPFTRIDLVSCRNFLIYIQPHIQKKILGFLRFALNMNGYLFLGPSETVGELEEELSLICSNWKIFKKVLSGHLAVTMSTPSVPKYSTPLSNIPVSQAIQAQNAINGAIPLYAYDLLLNKMIHNGILVNVHKEIIHVFGNAHQFLKFGSGRMTSEVTSVILPDLKSPLTTALHRAKTNKVEVSYVDINVKLHNSEEIIALTIMPLVDQKNKLDYFLIRVEVQNKRKIESKIETYHNNDASGEIVKELEDELQQTRESLQATIEEVETTNEELQSTNEELLASNEELQSTNEELHSVNEELYTVNSEHQKKIEELTSSNNDIDNFIRSTNIGTIFVDRTLDIKRYTPAIAKIFDLLPQDIGRPLKNFSHKILFKELLKTIKSVIIKKKPFSQEVRTSDDAHFFMRIQPYIAKHGSVEGAVISFVDIKDLKKAHEEAFENEARYRALIEATSAFVWRADDNGEFESGADAWCSYTGQKPEETKELGWLKALHLSDQGSCKAAWLLCLKNAKSLHIDAKVFSKAAGEYHYVRLEAAPLIDEVGEVFEWAFSLTDIDAEKRTDEKFRLAVQASPFSSLLVDKEGLITFVNESTLKILGFEQQELIGKGIEEIIPHASRKQHVRYREAYFKTPKARLMGAGIEVFALAKSGQEIPVEIRLSPIKTDDGMQILCSMIDISNRVKAEEILQRSTEELELRVFERTRELVDTNERLKSSEKQYTLLYDDAPDMYASIAPENGKILQCNNTLIKTLGYSTKEELLGQSIFDVYAPDCLQDAQKCFEQFKKEGRVDNTELTLIKINGERLPVMLKVNAIRDHNGRVLYSMSSWRDISMQKALEQEKKLTLELDLIYRSTQMVSASTTFEEALENCLELVCEVSGANIAHVWVPDNEKNRLEATNLWVSRGYVKSSEFKKSIKDKAYKIGEGVPGRIWQSGKTVWVPDINEDENFPEKALCTKLNISSVFGFPIIIHGKISAIFEFFSKEKNIKVNELLEIFQLMGEQVGHVLERKNVEKKFQELAHYDSVTGLPNRVYFHDTLNRVVSKTKRNNQSLAILYLDVDNFKKVNDSLGHPIGDKLLKDVAVGIKKVARDEDFVARLGGDEFVVLLEDINSYKESINLSKRILEDFERPFYIEGHEINSSVSIGISVYPSGGKDPYELQKNADMAMYRAKDMGKNTFQFFSKELNDEYQRQLLIESQLQHAIEKNELYLEYQPQITLKTGKLHGIEALIRWNNKRLGQVSPNEFIPIAEDTGLIAKIGHWVLEQSCEQLAAWQNEYEKELSSSPLVMSINVSVSQLNHNNITNKVKHILTELKLNPKNIMLEITETALMKNLQTSIKTLNELNNLGVCIGIDDFGTGYSSLSYLKQLPFDTLKIDQSFVQDVLKDPDDAAIVKAIIQLGSVMGLDIVAEGVEKKSELRFLKRAGCHYAQGYYFSKPISKDEIAQLIKQNKVF